MAQTINLIAGTSTSGHPAYEEVLVEPQGPGQYRLLRSPGLVLGVAAGDLVEVDSEGRHKVLKRAGNVCVQIFAQGNVDVLERDATAILAPLGARLDGKAPKELVYTISVNAGFKSIEAALNDVVRKHPSAEWYYGNVYDPSDGVTPLGWWTAPPRSQ